MVDAFPSCRDDSDRQFQLLIGSDLKNSECVEEAFERAFPLHPAAMASVVYERLRHHPRAADLYPKLFAAATRGLWLRPLLRRFAWVHAHATAGSPWPARVAAMLQLALEKANPLDEDDFIALAKFAPALVELHCRASLHVLAASVQQLEKAAPLSRRIVQALHELLPHRDARDLFVWPYFRSETSILDDGGSWSTRVRRDIAAIEPNHRAAFLRTFYGDPHAASRPTLAVLPAIKRLDRTQLAAALRRWVSMLRTAPGPIRWIEAVVLTHVIRLCEFLGGGECDQLLYEIGCSPWPRDTDLTWLDTYLWALTRRSQDRAFACLEALMMNPATATEKVQMHYEALLVVFGASARSDSCLGVDGFPLNEDPALQSHHTCLDQLFGLAADAAERGPYERPGAAAHLAALRSVKEEDKTRAMKIWEEQLSRPLPWFPVAPEITAALHAMEAAILKQFAADPAGLHRAAVAREDWINSHKHEFNAGTLQLWNELLHGLGCRPGLLERCLAPIEELHLEGLLDAIRTGGGNLKVFQLCRKYVADHGWNADLVTAFRKWIPTLGTAGSDQTTRAQAEWFVWFEDVAPIQANTCWSNRVKQDLRTMPAEELAAWRALLDNTTYIITGKPPKKWLKIAEAAFPQLGAARFRRRFVSWFAPFANSEPLRLTVVGRNLLRILMWYALIAEDGAVDEALLGFANAKWRTQASKKCAAQAEMAFSCVMSQRAPDAALPILEDLVSGGQAFEGSATHRAYVELCARADRRPARAKPRQQARSSERSANPLMDGVTVGDLQRAMKPRTT